MRPWMPYWIVAIAMVLCACGNETSATPPSVEPTISPATTETGGAQEDDSNGSIGAVLSDPGHERMAQTAPDEFNVLFHTSAGEFTVKVTRAWAPQGVDRFYNLVVNKFYDETRFFRVAQGRGAERFVVQWGIHGEPSVNEAWQRHPRAKIADDPVLESNTGGRVTFATSGPNSRTTQIFINYGDNSFLDAMGFAAFGEVSGEGMSVVQQITGEYGERPNQGQIQDEGNAYLKNSFPNLDYVISATIIE